MQIASIISGIPLLVIIVKAASFDIRNQEDYTDPMINIIETADVDPWSAEGIALVRFEQLKDQAIEVAENERRLHDEIWEVKREIRAFALEHSGEDDVHEKPKELLDALEKLRDELAAAQEKRAQASENAQKARTHFNEVMRGLAMRSE